MSVSQKPTDMWRSNKDFGIPGQNVDTQDLLKYHPSTNHWSNKNLYIFFLNCLYYYVDAFKELFCVQIDGFLKLGHIP